MKIREIRLQNGIFVYKAGISFTKWDFHLQRETLGLQTGLSLYISPGLIFTVIWNAIFRNWITIFDRLDCLKRIFMIWW